MNDPRQSNKNGKPKSFRQSYQEARKRHNPNYEFEKVSARIVFFMSLISLIIVISYLATR